LEKIKQYPQHTFQFLTKYPDIYFGKYKFPLNCWLGTTITGPLNKGPMEYYTEKSFNLNKDNLKFISFEPLLEKIEPNFKVGWVIIGAETGNRKGKVIPKKEWIEAIVNYCKCYKIPIYLKDSLKDIYPVEIKEFPKTEL
jgi:protein gp37